MDASRWLSVPQKQSKDIVVAIVPGLGYQAQVWRVGTTIGIPSCLFISVRPGQWVCQPAWSFKVLTLLIGAICDLNLSSQFLGFILSVADPDKVTEVDLLYTVACCTYLLVDLMPSSNGAVIV